MTLSLLNKHAIVCGSTDGIGKESALLLASKGCEITLVARNQEKLNKTKSELSKEYFQEHQTICADFDNSQDLKKKIETHLNYLEKPINILVNNSGGPKGGPLIDASEEEFRVAFERLLVCNHILARAVFPGMKEIGSGKIINIISTSVKQVIPGLGVSNTIRGSVAQWGKTLAIELGEYGVCVNNILPGYTATDRLTYLAQSKANQLGVDVEDIHNQWAENTSLKRIGTTNEIANTVLFLASDESSYITGHNFSVDGGRFSA